jgi:hypothetical protein
MPTGKYVKGSWKATCDRCGFDYHHFRLRREWTGLRTCSGPQTADCWDPRHPQDGVRGVADNQTTAWARPEPDAVFTSVVGDVSEDDL